MDDVGTRGHWEPTRSGLQREWTVRSATRRCCAGWTSVAVSACRGAICPVREWVRQRIEGCYDLDDIRVLNLFAGNGYVSAQALQAGATVVHVDASEA